MHRFRTAVSATAFAAATILNPGLTQAQYTANYQTNVISGVASNWTDSAGYVVGSNNFSDALLILNGGVLSNGYAWVGYEPNAGNNAVVVSGTGSVWSNVYGLVFGYAGSGNRLVITNGGQVVDNSCVVGSAGPPNYSNVSSNNTVVVTGTGSLWVSQVTLVLGDYGPNNQLIITDGGVVHDLGGIAANVGFSDNNTVLVSGTGSVWSNENGWLAIGASLGSYNRLTVTNGAQVYTASLRVGPGSGLGNSVLVTGLGSVLSAGYVSAGYSSQMTIANGGLVSSTEGLIPGTEGGSYNTVLVTDPGSVWSNQDELYVGDGGIENQLIVTNGGRVYDDHAYIGAYYSYDASVSVSGSGSVWSNAAFVSIGNYGTGDVLMVSDGGSVIASNIELGAVVTNDNRITVSGGNLVVTSSGSGVLDVPGGTLSFNGGLITTDSLLLTNGTNSVISFAAGTLNSGGTFVTNGYELAVGDGTNAANFHLLGGVHSFANGLRIHNAASLTGCGTINGNVTVDAGGAVLADCGGILTFNGSVTNNGLMQAINGTELEAYGPVVNNGTIDIITGSTNFHDGFINNGTVLDSQSVRIVQISISGTNVIVKSLSFVGHDFQLQQRDSLTAGEWTSVGAVLPGTNGTLTFTDTGGATNSHWFYRIDIFP